MSRWDADLLGLKHYSYHLPADRRAKFWTYCLPNSSHGILRTFSHLYGWCDRLALPETRGSAPAGAPGDSRPDCQLIEIPRIGLSASFPPARSLGKQVYPFWVRV